MVEEVAGLLEHPVVIEDALTGSGRDSEGGIGPPAAAVCPTNRMPWAASSSLKQAEYCDDSMLPQGWIRFRHTTRSC